MTGNFDYYGIKDEYNFNGVIFELLLFIACARNCTENYIQYEHIDFEIKQIAL